MTNIVMLGGNGHIGRNVTEQWLQRDPQAQFYVLSRSGKIRVSTISRWTLPTRTRTNPTAPTTCPRK